MDLDLAVLILFLTTTVVGFIWRRTGKTPWHLAWLGLQWVEIQVRKMRDKKGGKRSV
jgi:hypothetical protein